jgi:two-component system response regulator AdeR
MTQGAGASILVVEDEDALAETYARWLDADHTVQTAYTGEEALEVVDDDVDIVLLDRRLPGMSGGEVLETIRERGLDCRVAMLTAVDPDFDIFEMPFDDYAVKPVLREELNELVERLLLLATYDSQARQSFALASKVSVLEEEKTRAELESSEEYAAARERLAQLDDDIQNTLAEFDTEEFADAYRNLAREN